MAPSPPDPLEARRGPFSRFIFNGVGLGPVRADLGEVAIYCPECAEREFGDAGRERPLVE